MIPLNSAPSSRFEAYLLYAAIAVLLAAAVSGMVEPIDSIFQLVPRDYNEGWNAFWSDIAVAGGRLYPPPDSTVANNYPPLSFYLIGALGHVIGDNIIAGRLVATLSLAAIAVNIFLWTRAAGASRRIATFGAALFLAMFAAYAPAYIALDDPQLMAHAIMLSGVTLLLRGRLSTRALVGASLLMILGGLTKHLLLPLPLATTAWIALYRRDKLPVWIGSSVVLLGTSIGVIWMCYGMAFFDNMSAGRSYSEHLASNAVHRLINDLGWVLLVITAVVLAFERRRTLRKLKESAALGLLYLVLSAIVDALASGGAGVDRNAYFDFVIAACVCATLGLESIRGRNLIIGITIRGAPVAAVLGLAVGIMLAFQAAARVPSEWHELQRGPLREAEASAAIRLIERAGRGHAACEMLALCYWAKDEFTVDFYNFGQKLALHSLPPSACESVFIDGRITMLQLDRQPAGSQLNNRLPELCNQVISSHFSVVQESSLGSLMTRR